MPKDILPELRLADVAELTLAANVQPVSYGMVISDPQNAVALNSTNAGDVSAHENGFTDCVNYGQNTNPQIEMANEGLPGDRTNIVFSQMKCEVPDDGSSLFPAVSAANTQQNAAFGFNSQNVLYQADTPFANVTGGTIAKESSMSTGSTVYDQQDFIGQTGNVPTSLGGLGYNHGSMGMEMTEGQQKSNVQEPMTHDYNLVSAFNIDRTSGQNNSLVNQTSPHSEKQQQNFLQEVTMVDTQTENNFFPQMPSSEILHQSNLNTHQTEMNTQQMSSGINSPKQMYNNPEVTLANPQPQSNFTSPQVSPQQSATYSPQSQDNPDIDISHQQGLFQNNLLNIHDVYTFKLPISSEELNISSQHIEHGMHQTMLRNAKAGVGGQTDVVFSFPQQHGESNIPKLPVFPSAVQQGNTVPKYNIGPVHGEILQQTPFVIPQTGMCAQQAPFADSGAQAPQAEFPTPQAQTGINAQQAMFAVSQAQTGINVQQATFPAPQQLTGMNVQQAPFPTLQGQTGLNAQQATLAAPQELTGINAQQAKLATPQVQTGMNAEQATFAALLAQTGINAPQATFQTPHVQTGMNVQQATLAAPQAQIGMNGQQEPFETSQAQTGINLQQAPFAASQPQTGMDAEQAAFLTTQLDTHPATFVQNQQQMNSNIQAECNQQSFFANNQQPSEMNMQQIVFNQSQQITPTSQTETSSNAHQAFFANAEQVETNVQLSNNENFKLQTNINNSFFTNMPKEDKRSEQQTVFNNNQQPTNTNLHGHTDMPSQQTFFTNPQQAGDVNAQQAIFGNSQQQLTNSQEVWSSEKQNTFNTDQHFTPQPNIVSQPQAGINQNLEQSNNFKQQQFTNSPPMNTDSQQENLTGSLKFQETSQQTPLQFQLGHMDGNPTQQVQITAQHVSGQQHINTTQIHTVGFNAPTPMDTNAILPGKEDLNSNSQQYQGMQFPNDGAQETTTFSNAPDVLTSFQTGLIYKTQQTSDQQKQSDLLQVEHVKYDLGSLHPNLKFLNATIDKFITQNEPNQSNTVGSISVKQESNVSQLMPQSTDIFSPAPVLQDSNIRNQLNQGVGFQQYSEHMPEATFKQTEKNNSAVENFQTNFGINNQAKSVFNFETASSQNNSVLSVDITQGQNVPRSIQGLNQSEIHSQHVSRSTSGQASPSALDSPHFASGSTSGQLSPSLVPPQTQAQVNQFSKALFPRLLMHSNSEDNPAVHQDHNQHLSMEHDTNSQASLVALSEQLKIEPVAKTGPLGVFIMPGNLPQFDEETMFNINEEENIGVSNSLPNTSSASELSFSQLGPLTSSSFLTTSVETSATVTSLRSPSITTEPTDVFLRPSHQSPRCKKLTGRAKKMREASLAQQFSASSDGYQLQIVEQPEDQHRARYKTEGSRGSVKDRSQQGHPAVKLIGIQQPVNLQVFVGNDSGKVKPHGFYQACKVCGKNSTPCSEKDIEGTTVIEMQMDPSTDMLARIDCVGILKLRNADVEQRMGLAKAKAKKKSLKARLVFRVSFKRPDGSYQTLQVASHPILCTQPIGCPEISKKSLDESPVDGGAELYMIGKNFMKGTKVVFEEVGENGENVWEAEGEIDKDYFQNTHLICTVPAYRDSQITCPVTAQVVVRCNNKPSYPLPFTYTPKVKLERMEVESCLNKSMLNKVAPAALQLNEMIAQTTASSKGLFQLPAGVAQSILLDNKGVKMETNQDFKPCNDAVFSIQTQTPANQAFNPGRSVLISPTWTTQPLLFMLTNGGAVQSGISFSNLNCTTTSVNMQVGDILQQMVASNPKH